MLRKKTISLVIIDTESYKLARNAVDRTLHLFPVDDVIIFSDDESWWGGYSVIRIEKISNTRDYNKVLLGQLPHYLKTDFALVIQYDGFVVNPSSFTDFFFNFDFIGAPWPGFGYQGPKVGNGGFSLRSRRLVEAVVRFGDAIDVTLPEDAVISRLLRPLFEEMGGINFAPVEVAKYFSLEHEIPKSYDLFGFHGLILLPYFYKNDIDYLLENLPQRCFHEGSYYLNNLRTGFKDLGGEANSLLLKKVCDFN